MRGCGGASPGDAGDHRGMRGIITGGCGGSPGDAGAPANRYRNCAGAGGAACACVCVCVFVCVCVRVACPLPRPPCQKGVGDFPASRPLKTALPGGGCAAPGGGRLAASALRRGERAGGEGGGGGGGPAGPGSAGLRQPAGAVSRSAGWPVLPAAQGAGLFRIPGSFASLLPHRTAVSSPGAGRLNWLQTRNWGGRERKREGLCVLSCS